MQASPVSPDRKAGSEQQVEQVLAEVPPPEAVDPTAPAQVVLHAEADARSVGIAVLATIAAMAVLKWASAFFIPLMLGFVFYYALSPVVEALARARIPRWFSAAALIAFIVGATVSTIWSLSDDAAAMIDGLPETAHKLGEAVRRHTGGDGKSALDQVQKAATELERATKSNTAEPRPAPGVQRVVVERPRFNVADHLWSGTMGLVELVAQVTLVVFLTYFLLLSGDTFRRKLVKITGPTFTSKKLTVQALDEINAQMQRYLLVQLLSSVGVGIVTTVVFMLLGLNHAAVWGVAAGVLNLVPYIGAILVSVAATLAAFIQSGELDLPLYVAGVSLVLHVLEGYLIVPWLTSRASSMNAVAVFIGVLAWGWLWGVWGLLLGIPIMMVVKAVCDRVDELKPIGELLGT